MSWGTIEAWMLAWALAARVTLSSGLIKVRVKAAVLSSTWSPANIPIGVLKLQGGDPGDVEELSLF